MDISSETLSKWADDAAELKHALEHDNAEGYLANQARKLSRALNEAWIDAVRAEAK